MRGKKTGGRQKGTPNKVTATIKELAEPYVPGAIEKLAHLAENAESEQLQFAASKELLDRFFGKPRQSLSVMDETPRNDAAVPRPQTWEEFLQYQEMLARTGYGQPSNGRDSGHA